MHQKKTRNRLISILILLFFCSSGLYIILSNLNDNIVFFYPPSDIDKIKNTKSKVRIGGIVKLGSIFKDHNNTSFIITDTKKEIKVLYKGILPALFREKQGVIAEGKLAINNIFVADKLLTKHDENYIPYTKE